MIKYFLFILTSISISTFGFVELQYNKAEPETFEFYLSFASMGTKTNTQSPVSFGFYGVNYRFDNMGYGFNIYPVQLPNGDAFSWTSHNLQFHLYEDKKIWGSVPMSLQIGLVNLGLPQSSLKSSKFKNYLQLYYITNKIKFNQHLSYYVSGSRVASGSDFYYRHAFEYTYNKNIVFIEFSPNQNQVYIGGEVYFSKNNIFTIGVNISGDEPDLNGDYFYPSVVYGVRLTNPFIKKPKKPKPVPPVDIDLDTYLLMEKGLISYYDSDYKTALKHYLNVAKRYPTFELAHIRLGNAYYKLNQPALAKKHWQQALIINPNNNDVFEMLQRMDNQSEAIQSLIDD